jgi:hypothetical protein
LFSESIFPLLLPNPNWSSRSALSIFFSILPLSTFSTIFAVSMKRLSARCSLHYVACGYYPIQVRIVRRENYLQFHYFIYFTLNVRSLQ